MSFSLISCSKPLNIQSKDYVISLSGWETFYEDSVFYRVSGSNNMTLMYCSAEVGRCAPICANPNCNHDINEFPECCAAVNDARGILKDENGIYYFDDDGIDVSLFHADINGSNKRKIASFENGILYTPITYVYGENYVLYVYYDMQGLDEMDEDDFTYSMSDKYSNFIDYADIGSGEVKNLLTKKDYAAKISNAMIYENCLIYVYTYYTKDIRDLNKNESLSDYYRSGLYSYNLETGEEKKLSEGFDKMEMIKQSFDFFNPEKIICKNYDDSTIYLYSLSSGKFTSVDKCGSTYLNFAADDTNIIYTNSTDEKEEYRCYSLETGEITSIPFFAGKIRLECIVQDTVWLTQIYEDGSSSPWGYINKSDFLSGNYDNIKFIS